ncbi:MAG: hypothetical protein RSA66_06140 [Muribaculaceae bacterium]
MINKNNFILPKGEIFNVTNNIQCAFASVADSADIFDEDIPLTPLSVPGYDSFKYIPFGPDNNLPFEVIRMIGEDEIMSQNKLFNVLTCYGNGLRYNDIDTDKPTKNVEIKRFMMQNSMPDFFLEQSTDIKYFYFSVACIILSKDAKKIVKVRHKEACYCRFEKADNKGRINHIFYANWRQPSSLTKNDVEILTLLEEKDPLGHLEVLMGRAPGIDGIQRVRTTARKFAVVCRIPTPGSSYYPTPYYTAIFRGDWFDIKKLIGKGKKAKLKNHASVKYQVEVHRDYWLNLCDEEGIHDPLKQVERIKKEKENIKNFVSGIENSGKVWITGYYIDPNGKENRMVRVAIIDSTKEGGDWSDDIQEASNMTCYGDNIHPNLVGATPGKSQSNNSGSDKRELFTLKQSLEVAFHDVMLKVHNVIIYYNAWSDKVYPDVPMITLTTLDKKADAISISNNNNKVIKPEDDNNN